MWTFVTARMARQTSNFLERLEGDASLLEAGYLRYRAIAFMLGRILWRARIRRNADLVRATARAETELQRALERAEGRARVEAWPRESAAWALLRRISQVRSLLWRRLQKKLGTGFTGALSDQLYALERRVLVGVLPAEALAPDLLEVQEASLRGLEFGQRWLQTVSLVANDARPLSAEELRALALWVMAAQASLDAVSARLRMWVPRPPLGSLRSGPAVVRQLTYFVSLARAQLRPFAEAQLVPLEVSETVSAEAVLWLTEGPAGRVLPPESARVSRSDRGLWALARAFGGGSSELRSTEVLLLSSLVEAARWASVASPRALLGLVTRLRRYVEQGSRVEGLEALVRAAHARFERSHPS